MNVKITLEESLQLNDLIIDKYIMGSRLYGTHNEDSDTDYLVLYKPIGESDIYYPNTHQLQYDDVENNTQYIYSTQRQFWKNIYSGESTINVDIVLFCLNYTDQEKLNICRTYNIIKSFLGLAKRDMRFIKKGKSKLFHVLRGLYCVEKLLDNQLPILSDIKEFKNKKIYFPDLIDRVENLRNRLNKLYEENELTLYPKNPICEYRTKLEKKIIDSNNIKEFRYEK